MDIAIRPAREADARRLAEVFNAAFHADYVKYGLGPEQGKTERDMLDGMREFTVYGIVADGEIVGTIALYMASEDHIELATLCVIPEYANRGVGQRAMALLDEVYPHVTHWSLETPADGTKNHHFYEKLGYRVTREYTEEDIKVSRLERRRSV